MKERLLIKKLPFKFWRQKRLGSNDQGFSLVETVLVIAIVAIAAAMTVPNILSSIPSWELNRAANDIFSNLQWARLTAIRENVDCQVLFDVDEDSYQVILSPGTPNERVVRSIEHDFSENIDLSTTGSGIITFNSRGISNSLTVTVSNTSGSYNVWPLTSGVINKMRTS